MAKAGSFYFAWASSTETSFNGSHLREDELIFSFDLKHDEGQVAELDLEIINPHIGLLAPGRPLWAWFSWHDGVTAYPLFFGRLVGIPDSLTNEIITIKFVAKPNDYAEQQLALADSLSVLPFYDPIFIDEKKIGDPSTVLEGYSAIWHVDRVTHQVTISDIIAGEDGIAEFTADDVFYDKLEIKLAGAPLMVCEVEAQVQWVQTDNTGVVELQTPPNLTGDPTVAAGMKATTDYQTAIGQQPGGGGFQVQDNEPQQYTYTWKWFNPDSGPFADGDLMEAGGSESVPFYGGTVTQEKEQETPGNPDTGQGQEYSYSAAYEFYDLTVTVTHSPPSGTDPANTDQNMQIAVDVAQNRTEKMHVRVIADVQPVLTEATESDDSIKDSLSMNARDVVVAGAATPSDGAYFPTERGLQSLEYLLMVARAHLLAGSRVFSVSWECSFDKVIGLSCRQNALIEDARLPGGSVLGKIVSYQMAGDGDKGEFLGSVTINSAVGNGSALTTAAGVPDYVDDGYVDAGYQHYSGRLAAAITNDMAFEAPAYVAAGLQLPISLSQILVRNEFIDTGRDAAVAAAQQAAAMAMRSISPDYSSGGPSADYSTQSIAAQAAINKAYADHPVWMELELKPVQNISTDVEYDASVAPLVIPKQVDLAAASTP